MYLLGPCTAAIDVAHLAYCTYPRRLIDDDDEDDFLEQLVE
jgi:hypothetical protein